MRRGALLGVLAAALAGCGDGSSYVLVTLRSGAPLALDSLRVTVGNGGQTTTTTVDRALSIPPDQSFTFQFGRERSGAADFEVRAFGQTGELAEAHGQTTLVPGGTATLTLDLTPPSPDGGGVIDTPLHFRPRNVYTVGEVARSISFADFNGDDVVDVAIASGGQGHLASGPGEVTVLLGVGDGTFKPQMAAAVGTSAGSMFAVDANRDGRLDLLGPVPDANAIAVLLGKGDGSFQTVALYPTGNLPQYPAVADFDGDGFPDIVVLVGGNGMSETLMLHRGRPGGEVAAGQVIESPTAAIDDVLTADVNGDRIADLVIVANGEIDVAFGAGDGTFRPGGVTPHSLLPFTACAADLNGDGHEDLILSDSGTMMLGVFLGKGDGTFAAAGMAVVGARAISLVAGDVNRDGAVDVVAADNGDNTFAVVLGKGDGTFFAPQAFATERASVIAAVGDLNGDGRPDVATVSQFGLTDVFVQQ